MELWFGVQVQTVWPVQDVRSAALSPVNMLLVTAKNSLFKLMKLCLLTGIRGSADAFGATLSSPNGFSFACNAHNWGLSLKTDKSERTGSIFFRLGYDGACPGYLNSIGVF